MHDFLYTAWKFLLGIFLRKKEKTQNKIYNLITQKIKCVHNICLQEECRTMFTRRFQQWQQLEDQSLGADCHILLHKLRLLCKFLPYTCTFLYKGKMRFSWLKWKSSRDLLLGTTGYWSKAESILQREVTCIPIIRHHFSAVCQQKSSSTSLNFDVPYCL